jgi:hypothetical protein
MLKETCIYVRTAVKAPMDTKTTAAQCDQEADNRNPHDNRRNRRGRWRPDQALRMPLPRGHTHALDGQSIDFGGQGIRGWS